MPEQEPLDPTRALQLAVSHASALLSAEALPDALDGARVDPESTPVFDVNGSVLFRRASLFLPNAERDNAEGYLDVAAAAEFGTLLIAVAPNAIWHPQELLEEARKALGRRRDAAQLEARFVAYSYPKLAVQFLSGEKEVAMLELHTWTPIPKAPERKKGEQPGNFERWSFLEELPTRIRNRRLKKFDQTVEEFEQAFADLQRERLTIAKYDISNIFKLTETRDLHYSGRSGDHSICYELRGQETNVWCVAASAQMLLDFYRYDYTQTRIAQIFGLGTMANPNGLYYSQIPNVPGYLETMTSNALDAAWYSTTTFARFKAEIRANRPVISFIPGHSRSVAGFTETTWIFATLGFRGLNVFDPWPPNSGVITRWENFDTQTYIAQFTARLTLV